jgi:hypothetical protein
LSAFKLEGMSEAEERSYDPDQQRGVSHFKHLPRGQHGSTCDETIFTCADGKTVQNEVNCLMLYDAPIYESCALVDTVPEFSLSKEDVSLLFSTLRPPLVNDYDGETKQMVD